MCFHIVKVDFVVLINKGSRVIEVDELGVTRDRLYGRSFGESMNIWWLILEVFSILQSHMLMLWKT